MSTTEALELRTSRILPAPLDDVWEVYTVERHIRNWFNILEPDTYLDISMDFRVGGRMIANWGPDEATAFHETQTFVEIEPKTRIVAETSGGDPSGNTLSTHVEVTFEALEGAQTLMSVVQWGFPTARMRDWFRETAWQGAFLRISTYLERGSAN
jgi:uncharacterized protein YndB with AHSA1/START domain